jgi:ABC-type sugar transport system ATPase subunit
MSERGSFSPSRELDEALALLHDRDLAPVDLGGHHPAYPDFSRDEHSLRYARLAALLEAYDLDALVLTQEESVRYLSGYVSVIWAVGRWLAGRPRVLLLDEPTRGIDVGARAQIYEIVQSLTEDGTAVLLVSSELEELLAIADRVLVLREGRLRGWFPHGTPQEEVATAMAGSR